jgi:hypothetical protein
MPRFEDALAALEADTGWKAMRNATEAAALFALEDLDFQCRSPDDRRLQFLFRLYALAPDEAPETKARGYARMAAASARRRRSILSFHEGAFYLHLEADLTKTLPDEIPGLCQEFLNDCDWWRQNAPPAFG